MRRKPRDEARKARNDVYRQHIFEAAERVFAEKGYETAKVQDISAAAALSMGTIYAVFPGKTELFMAVLEERGQELLRLARGVCDSGQPPLATLHALIALYIDYFLAHPDFLRMHLRSGASWGLTPATDATTRVAHWTDILALQSEIFRRGVDGGVFVDEDPATLSRLFSVMDQVLLSEWVAGGMKTDRDTLVRRLTALCERAFCAPGRRTGNGRGSPT